ncbi:cell division ATP-binding protein FtsE [Thermodesulfobacterium hydrogeniphilum]|uniref:cell division ATP-binding protein FtsE n=1 Tax=Thermodesulfobacterium hydrogeniphilum TaxID=161156 RepID=UPI00056F9B26|nr:ATP-binding cassette domain-containing protein [Thermodesulfobacterium hydrogeniphilum]
MNLFSFQNVNKIYPPYFKALININLEIKEGDFIILTGSTGAGKTTLLKLLYREEKPTSGEIFYKNISYSELKTRQFNQLRQKWGIIFQDYKLFPDLSVYENIKISLILSGKKFKNMKIFIYEYLERFLLAHKAQKKIKELSGGEQQKVGVIRALIRDPEVLIADEPTGNLDPDSIKEILQILKEFHNKGKTIILATHDPIIINQKLGKLIRLKQGELINNVELFE